jgi:chemotaxis protein CheX
MLGLTMQPRSAPPEVNGDRQISAFVQLNGDWEGAVAVNCTDALAKKVAAALFDVDGAEASEVDVHDAIGEVANMTAGQVKTLVSGYCRLSLPIVTAGTELSVSMPGSRVLTRASFDCGSEAFSVIVLQKA